MSNLTSGPFKILIVDDEVDAANAVKHAIEDVIENVDIRIETSFKEGLSQIKPFSFDCVILDLFEGQPNIQDNNAGEKIWQSILNETFLPVIIFTAADRYDLDPDFPDNNPILKCFTKSVAGLDELVIHINSICPHMLELREIFNDFHNTLKYVLLETTPFIWDNSTLQEFRSRLLVSSARRRLAAMMDEKSMTDSGRLHYEEQYLIPPLGESLLTGDILFRKGSDDKDPSSYLVVLTPSCDLQPNKGRTRVDFLLAAKCKPVDNFLKACGLSVGKDKGAVREKLKTFLTQPHANGYVLVPGFSPFIPSMAASLRELELLNLSAIGVKNAEDNYEFYRIASIDSPFREQLAWAYIQISGRPGIPDRDLDQCISNNFSALAD